MFLTNVPILKSHKSSVSSDKFVMPKQKVSNSPKRKVDVGTKSNKTFEKHDVKFIPRVLMKSSKLQSRSFENVDKSFKQSTFQTHLRQRPKSPSKVSTSVIFDPKVYYKQNFSKQQMWRPKGETEVGEESSNSSGEWFDAIRVDATGQYKTVRAWIPKSH